MNNTDEMWQAEVNGQIYDAAFSELAAWVGDNALLPGDKVRRGNLRWLEAGKVPSLMPFFNAKEVGVEPPKIPVSAVDGENANIDVQIRTENFAPVENQQFKNESQMKSYCVIHDNVEAGFVCETCFNNFCQACPPDVGLEGKICPLCGAWVKSAANQTQVYQPEDLPVQPEEFPQHFDEFHHQPQRSQTQPQPVGNFGFGDFGRALIHPFKYKTTLIFGALMYMFFTLGQLAYAVGGMFMLFAALISAMLANMLSFGILSNVIENFSIWKTDTNFMPGFEDFSLWDDVVHPFFLTLATYIVSFGLFIAIVIGGGWYMIGSLQSEMLSIRQNATSTVMPGMNSDLDKLKQSQQLQNTIGDLKTKIEESRKSAPIDVYNEQQQIQDVQKAASENQLSELESATTPESEAHQAQMNEMGLKLLQKALPLVILAGLAFLFGVFYFPAACAVAGYTRSLAATLNPKIGLDTIKNLGSDYALIMLMLFIIGVVTLTIAVTLHIILLPFAIPMVGNIPALAVTSWVSFYMWIVVSCILGAAIGKNSHKLGIYRG